MIEDSLSIRVITAEMFMFEKILLLEYSLKHALGYSGTPRLLLAIIQVINVTLCIRQLFH